MAKKYGYVSLTVNKGNLIGISQRSAKEQHMLNSGDVIYIYRGTSSKCMYIGQTKNFIKRNTQHFSGNEEKFNSANFNEVIILYSQYFNGSALDDVESQLITYLKSDVFAQYSAKTAMNKVIFEENAVINRTNGNSVNSYKDQEKVSTEVILPFWETDLFKMGWVNTKTLDELRNKSLIKYSPIKSLTNQQAAIIKQILDTPKKNFVINGDAGTGKTVLLTHLIAKIITQSPDLQVAVVVQPNWIDTAEEIFGVFGLRSKNLTIASSTSLINTDKKFDLIIVDEAHKISRRGNKQMALFNGVYKTPKYSKLINHLQIIKKMANQIVLMYDAFQGIRPANISRTQFSQDTKEFKTVYLKTQFRINANQHSQYTSDDYINGIKYLLYKDTGLLTKNNFDKNFNRGIFREKSPDSYFGYFEDEPLHKLNDWVNEDRNIYPNHVNRILGGLVEPWVQKDGKNAEKTHWHEGDINYRWNSTQENWINSTDSDAEDQIGSVFAVQGIDLNNAGVLIGNDLLVNENGHLYAERSHFHNINGVFTNEEAKLPKNQREFTLFVLNIYYVLLTRGIDGVRIGFWHNPSFKKYFLDTLIRSRS